MLRRTLAAATALATLALMATVAPVAVRVVSALPGGFVTSNVASVSAPTGIEQLPDGRVVVLQQSGQVRLINNGALVPQAALDIAVCSGGERGVLGFTASPDFLADAQVYLYYTRTSPSAPGGCVNRVSRFTMRGDVIQRDSEVVLVDDISSVNGNHNGGDLAIGRDGFLYVSVGDAGRDPRGNSGSAGGNDAARDLSLLNGKILRVDRTTGVAATTNPLVASGAVSCRLRGNTADTPTSTCAEIYAWGLRNPWRIAFDPNPGAQRFFINDVGQGTREEVDLGASGADFGWNTREGVCPQGQNPPCAGPPPGLTDPIVDYGHSAGRAFITAGAFIPNGVWPQEYDGGYLFADGASGEIWLRRADGSVAFDQPFATGAQGIADMAFVREPTGWSVWYTVAGGSSNNVRRIMFPFAAGSPSSPLRFVPNSQAVRVLDTRLSGDGAAPIAAGATRSVVSGVDGATNRAVLANVAYVSPSTDGFLTAWASQTAMPATANVNAIAGEVVSNLAVIPIGSDGKLLLFTNATAHVVIDVLGRFELAPTAVSAGRFTPVSPTRLADTRESVSGTNVYSRLAGTPYPKVRVPVAGRGGVPATGTASVALVVTALSGPDSAGGFLTATAGGAQWSATANLNTNGSGDIRPNTVVVPVGADGTVDLHLFNVADVVVDVAGWFTDASAPATTAGRFVSVPPTREVDTRIRQGFGRLTAGTVGLLDPTSAPANAAALAQNVAIVDNAAPGFVTPFPGGTPPLVAAGNVTAPGQVRSILSLTKLGPTGTMSYYTFMDTQLVIDVTGWFEG